MKSLIGRFRNFFPFAVLISAILSPYLYKLAGLSSPLTAKGALWAQIAVFAATTFGFAKVLEYLLGFISNVIRYVISSRPSHDA